MGFFGFMLTVMLGIVAFVAIFSIPILVIAAVVLCIVWVIRNRNASHIEDRLRIQKKSEWSRSFLTDVDPDFSLTTTERNVFEGTSRPNELNYLVVKANDRFPIFSRYSYMRVGAIKLRLGTIQFGGVSPFRASEIRNIEYQDNRKTSLAVPQKIAKKLARKTIDFGHVPGLEWRFVPILVDEKTNEIKNFFFISVANRNFGYSPMMMEHTNSLIFDDDNFNEFDAKFHEKLWKIVQENNVQRFAELRNIQQSARIIFTFVGLIEGDKDFRAINQSVYDQYYVADYLNIKNAINQGIELDYSKAIERLSEAVDMFKAPVVEYAKMNSMQYEALKDHSEDYDNISDLIVEGSKVKDIVQDKMIF